MELLAGWISPPQDNAGTSVADLIHRKRQRCQRVNITVDALRDMLCVRKLRIQQIADRFGCSYQSVQLRIRRYGLAVPGTRMENVTLERILQLRERGYNAIDIAAQLGCSRHLVYKRLRDGRKV
jgi:AraC-like DNA-binding protein